MRPIDLAKVVLRAAEIKEKSFDHISCFQDGVIKADEAVREGKDPDDFHNMIWDFDQYYKLDQIQSIEQALAEGGWSKEFTTYIDLSFHWSNDVLDWAKNQVRKQMWEYKFITLIHPEDQYDKGWMMYAIWDETQANELGRYDTWEQCVFWLRRHAETLI